MAPVGEVAGTTMSPGAVIVGSSLSTTVTVKLQVAVSPNWKVLTVVPTGKVEPLRNPVVWSQGAARYRCAANPHVVVDHYVLRASRIGDLNAVKPGGAHGTACTTPKVTESQVAALAPVICRPNTLST